MDLNSLPLFQMISGRMGWLSERQKLLAQNVANADTPGYKPRDLKPLNFRTLLADAAARRKPAGSEAGQRGPGTGIEGALARARQKPAESAPSGNAVSIEAEVMKVAETAMDHQLTTNIYRRQLGMIRTALGRGGGPA
ncbi:MAG: flagellar basal body rod protein FlgB [Pseudomonadota bacterium]